MTETRRKYMSVLESFRAMDRNIKGEKMYYVIEVKTSKIVYLSRWASRARRFVNSIRGGLSYRIERKAI